MEAASQTPAPVRPLKAPPEPATPAPPPSEASQAIQPQPAAPVVPDAPLVPSQPGEPRQPSRVQRQPEEPAVKEPGPKASGSIMKAEADIPGPPVHQPSPSQDGTPPETVAERPAVGLAAAAESHATEEPAVVVQDAPSEAAIPGALAESQDRGESVPLEILDEPAPGRGKAQGKHQDRGIEPFIPLPLSGQEPALARPVVRKR